MPSTSAKQHRFMQAVAHSPSFAKKAGVSQSVGKDFSAADKGKTFNKGGTMKKGKRFNGEDGESGVEYHDYDPDKTYSGRFTDDETGALAENTPTRAYKPEKRETEDTPAPVARVRTRAVSAPAPAPAPAPAATASETAPKAAPKAAPEPRTTAQQGRYGKTDNKTRGRLYLRGTEEEQEAEGEKRMEVVMAAMPLGRLGLVGRTVGKPALQTIERQLLTGPARTGQYLPAPRTARLEASRARLADRSNAPVSSGPLSRRMAEKGGGGSEYNRRFGATDGKKRGGGISRFAKGGSIMDSKKMVGKEVAFMKKKGAPSSMIKHEKAEMGMKAGGMARGGMPPEVIAAMRAKQAARQQPMRRPPPGGMPPPAQPPMGMKKGGVAKFAKGGGIESRGKTKGTIIRMAAGGSVSSRADGIAQRGKTKFTNY